MLLCWGQKVARTAAWRDGAIQVNALTPAQAETVMALIGETRDVARTDPALQEIVLDELDYYLAGAHTAEETAANIQSRASVYVAERST